MLASLFGALIGGFFTIVAAVLAIKHQSSETREHNRLDNMPVLCFTVAPELEPDIVVTCLEGELCTSASDIFSKKYCSFSISSLGGKAAFDLQLCGCMINDKLIPCGAAFAPALYRLVGDESVVYAFDITECMTNVFVLFRFSYEDIFGNVYYQDVPFTYMETDMWEQDNGHIRQIVELRDIKKPVLKSLALSLEESAKTCGDYETFAGE